MVPSRAGRRRLKHVERRLPPRRGSLPEVLSACRNVTSIPAGPKHALLVLASYWPHVFPSQARLGKDMGVDRSNVNRRLRALVDAGLVVRHPGGPGRPTVYVLQLDVIRGLVSDESDSFNW